MENKKNYKTSKTEFLFESDAEKAVLNAAAKNTTKKNPKQIIISGFLICFLFIFACFGTIYYKNNELQKINASMYQLKISDKISERTNSYSNKLKEVLYENSDKYTILVNKNNPVDNKIIENYKIINIKENHYKNIKLEEKTYNEYKKIKNDLKEKGYTINIKSGFISLDDSKYIFGNYVFSKGQDYARKYIPNVGESEHNLGIAFDFELSNNDAGYDYLMDIAHLYGFILRYPKDKEQITGYNYSKYHLRYVGLDLAKYLKKNNLTLEEYYK